ncbi:hypothetical protein GCM10010145_46920 [Streptomyces ruber]|uniref:Uncharacterized protein n=2 Tax=Streptomyces TaxID=1883 RepID=A0A918BJF3_9ACTN|nr:hypothetical protein GCM10010145_46920 [Streptomyces ruber]
MCATDRGEVVAGTPLDAMHTTEASAGALRYVYPVRSTEGRVTHWQAGTDLPQGPALSLFLTLGQAGVGVGQEDTEHDEGHCPRPPPLARQA